MLSTFENTPKKGENIPFWQGPVSISFSLTFQRKPGTEGGPHYLRAGGLVRRLNDLGCSVHDHGDVEFEDISHDTEYKNVKNPRNVASGTLRVCGVYFLFFFSEENIKVLS